MKAYPNLISFDGKSFLFYIRRSTYFHIVLFLLTIFSVQVVYKQQEKLREKNIVLIQSSVRVDMVEMPKYTLNELKNVSSGEIEVKNQEQEIKSLKTESKEILKEEIKKEEKNEAPTFEEFNKVKRESFLSKLKQIGKKKINNDKNEKEEIGLHGEKETDLKKLVLAGNKLSNGAAIYGDGTASDLTTFQAYAGRLPDLVRPNWRLPSFLMGKKLKCRVRVWIAQNGEIVRAEVYQTSGDNEYDQKAIEAVKASSPFPKLSNDLVKRGLNGDIALGFPL